MRSKALLEQAKHDFFRFWIKTSIVCGIIPPHHLTSERQGELAVAGSSWELIEVSCFFFKLTADQVLVLD